MQNSNEYEIKNGTIRNHSFIYSTMQLRNVLLFLQISNCKKKLPTDDAQQFLRLLALQWASTFTPAKQEQQQNRAKKELRLPDHLPKEKDTQKLKRYVLNRIQEINEMKGEALHCFPIHNN